MERYFYELGQKDSYYGLSMITLSTFLPPGIKDAYLNGYADYCESCV